MQIENTEVTDRPNTGDESTPLLQRIATYLAAEGYEFTHEPGRLVFAGDEDIAGTIEDGFPEMRDILKRVKVYDEVVDYEDLDVRITPFFVVEEGKTVSAEDRYRGRFDDAVVDATEAMVNLNRYAKRAERREFRDDRREIYELKDRLIEVLFGRNLCVGTWIHEQEYEARERYFGSAFDDDDDFYEGDNDDLYEDEDDEPSVEIRRFVVFKFKIRDKYYTWHCPKEEVRFDYSSAPRLPDTRTSLADAPPLRSCDDFNLTEALDVVRYVIEVAKETRRQPSDHHAREQGTETVTGGAS